MNCKKKTKKEICRKNALKYVRGRDKNNKRIVQNY